MWVKNAIWKVGDKVQRVAMAAGPGATVEQVYGQAVFAIFQRSPEAMQVQLPVREAVLEMDLFVQPDRDTLGHLFKIVHEKRYPSAKR